MDILINLTIRVPDTIQHLYFDLVAELLAYFHIQQLTQNRSQCYNIPRTRCQWIPTG